MTYQLDSPANARESPGWVTVSVLVKAHHLKKADVSLVFVGKYLFEAKRYRHLMKAARPECIVKTHHNYLIIIKGFIKFIPKREALESSFDSGSE